MISVKAAFGIGVICIGGLLSYSLLQSPQNSDKQLNQLEAQASATASTSVKRLQSPAPQNAAAHLSVIRDTVKLAEANINQASGEPPDTTAAESARLRSEELEKTLIDSMAKLTQQFASDPASVSDAIALLESEADPALMMMLAQAIGEAAAAMGDKFPHEALLKIAQGDSSDERRRAALVALGYMTKIPADVQQRIAELSRTAPSMEVRTAAVECMGSWMGRNPELIRSVSENLLATRESTDDAGLRGIVIQTIGNTDSPLSRKVYEAMADAVVHEVLPHNRSLAALALGSGVGSENREAILASLEAAYVGESNLDTQRHLITQITKAARYDAEDYLTRLPAPHPLLAQDIQDYVEILASADRKDWGAIWDKKSERDHQRGTYPNSGGGHGAEN